MEDGPVQGEFTPASPVIRLVTGGDGMYYSPSCSLRELLEVKITLNSCSSHAWEHGRSPDDQEAK